MRPPLKPALATLLLTLTLTLAAQETGPWRATSSNARAITGDVALSAEKLTINFLLFTMVRIRALDKTEAASAFDTETYPNGAGSLYRLQIPATQKFLRKNTLCGSDETEWMAAYATPHSLQLAFFSSQKPPVFTREALADSSDRCDTFSYVR